MSLAGSPRPKPQPSKVVQYVSIGFMAAGIGIYQGLASRWFPTPPGGGLNLTRILVAGLVGGVCGGVGAALGKLIKGLRR